MGEGPDPRRWITLAICILAALISSIDNTVLNVAIPAILHEFHADLPTVQWVVSGYALTFATLLVVGGRLGDVYGHRRALMLGATVFAGGSLLASFASGMPMLLFGEAFLEGVGAALMMPATTAIISTTFSGKERGTAFAAWGATVGAAAAFGPALGGFLTTHYSWRWALRINVFLGPAAALAAWVFVRRDHQMLRRLQVDLVGAVLIGGAMFLAVFGLSEGPSYGWTSVRIVGVFLAAALLLAGFYTFERGRELRHKSALFDFGQLRHRGYRYGLITSFVMAMGQLGLIFVLPIVLQNGKGLSASETGLWLVPFGVLIVVGAQLGGRLTHRFGPPAVIRTGFVLEAIGLVLIALLVSPDITLGPLVVGFAFFGIGYGFASAQLVNVVLSDVDHDKTGVAGAFNTTVRQLGAALGVAVVGALFSMETVRHGTAAIGRAAVSPSARADAVAQLHARGVNFAVPPGVSGHDASILRRAVATAIGNGARPSLLFTAVAVLLAGAVALLLPRHAVPVEEPPLETVAG